MDVRVLRTINSTLSVEEGVWIEGKFMDHVASNRYLKSLGFNSKEAAQYTRVITQVYYDKEGK